MGRKGTGFEYEILEYLRDHIKGGENSYRITNSGANKNTTSDKSKTGRSDIKDGDVVGIFEQLPFLLFIECKERKSTSKVNKRIVLDKNWIDEIRHTGEENDAISALAFKFKHCRKNDTDLKNYTFYNEDSNAIHISFPIDHFVKLLNYYYDVQHQESNLLSEISNRELLEELYKRVEKLGDS